MFDLKKKKNLRSFSTANRYIRNTRPIIYYNMYRYYFHTMIAVGSRGRRSSV